MLGFCSKNVCYLLCLCCGVASTGTGMRPTLTEFRFAWNAMAFTFATQPVRTSGLIVTIRRFGQTIHTRSFNGRLRCGHYSQRQSNCSFSFWTPLAEGNPFGKLYEIKEIIARNQINEMPCFRRVWRGALRVRHFREARVAWCAICDPISPNASQSTVQLPLFKHCWRPISSVSTSLNPSWRR